MIKSIEIIRKDEQRTSHWSGGTTTQLLIYPKEADYSTRDFKWRVSSARVEAEESAFTNLPGISRIIMILDGELLLNHEGHYSKTLKPFEQDSFMGDWVTKSVGRVTDFNLMMADGCTGNLDALSMQGEETIEMQFEGDDNFKVCTKAFYIVSGEVEVNNENDIIELSAGDILSVSLTNADDFKLYIHNKGNNEAKIVRTEIFC